MRKATAAQDCKGQILARDLLAECEASGQMTPEQAYQHWLAGEIGHRKEGGVLVVGDDSTRLNSDRCTVCAGHCPSIEYCHLAEPENTYGMGWSLGWLAFFAAVGVGCLVMAAMVGMP